MTLVKAGLGAAGGALLGMVVWVAIGYFTGFEVGYVAVAIGAAAGFGATLVAGATECDTTTGVVAGAISVLAVLGAKYAVIYMVVEKTVSNVVVQHVITEDDVKNELADAIVEEREAAGKTIQWPKSESMIDQTEGHDWPAGYPKDIVTEAGKRWDALSADEQAAKKAQSQADYDQWYREFNTVMKPDLRWSAYKGSFGGFDVLWILLAVASAYKLGSGATND